MFVGPRIPWKSTHELWRFSSTKWSIILGCLMARGTQGVFFFVFSVGPLFKLNVNLLEGNLNLHHVVEMFLEFPCINVWHHGVFPPFLVATNEPLKVTIDQWIQWPFQCGADDAWKFFMRKLPLETGWNFHRWFEWSPVHLGSFSLKWWSIWWQLKYFFYDSSLFGEDSHFV